MASLAFEAEHGIDHMLEHARAGDGAVLGDVADEDERRQPLSLAKRISSCGRGADLADRPRRALDQVRIHGLDRIDDEQRRRRRFAERGQDVAHRGRRGEPERGRAEAEPARAQPHLIRRLLAGNISDGKALRGDLRGRLQQQGRLADAGIAADQACRAGDEAAAERPVELGDAGRDPRPAARRRASRPTRSIRRPPPRRLCRAEKGVTTPSASSTRLFHSLQSAHCPAQRGLTEPQSWQT